MKKNYDFSKAVKNPHVKRIIVSVKIENVGDVSKSVRCDAFVDTDVPLMMLPAAWKDTFGALESTRTSNWKPLVKVYSKAKCVDPFASRSKASGRSPAKFRSWICNLKKDVLLQSCSLQLMYALHWTNSRKP
jgi:hypothetical protein